MATDFETEQQSASSLLSGIVQDAKQLFTEQLRLFQVEIKNDFQRTIWALLPLAIGVVITLPGVLLLLFAAAHFVNWMVPDMPTFGGFAIVGGVVLVLGIGLIFWGKAKLSSINPMPDVALQGLKENLQWKTKN
jgi:uncharacterized membrane protein YqjE